jgi:hypothetical protein
MQVIMIKFSSLNAISGAVEAETTINNGVSSERPYNGSGKFLMSERSGRIVIL